MLEDAIPMQLPAVEVLLQPIVALDSHAVVAVEALSRLADGVPVLHALGEAEKGGQLDRLEAYLLRQGLAARHRVPSGSMLSLNVTAGALTGDASYAVLEGLPNLEGLVLELRQEGQWDADPELLSRIKNLRDRGALFALDDAARGFHGLLAIGQLQPDWVKLDRSVVTGAKDDAVRRAGLEMFAQSAQRSGSLLVAEGVETEDDLVALHDVGVTLAQGYYFAAPMSGVVPSEVLQAST
jgi:EAL domain-containing protein (putative c-di-GMP-specific phosphodiesterase class I)